MDGRGPAILVGGAPAVDFLNSIATPVDATIDWIADGDGLLDWLKQARLVPGDALKAVRAQALPGELDKAAGQARTLREWFRGFVREHMGRALTPEAIDELGPLNALLERDETFSRIVARRERDGGRLQLQTMRPWRTPESLLLLIGEALARCVCDEDFANIRACEGQSCTLIFADRTRRRARRWCSMAICGNRAKQAAHRDRLKNRR